MAKKVKKTISSQEINELFPSKVVKAANAALICETNTRSVKFQARLGRITAMVDNLRQDEDCIFGCATAQQRIYATNLLYAASKLLDAASLTYDGILDDGRVATRLHDAQLILAEFLVNWQLEVTSAKKARKGKK